MMSIPTGWKRQTLREVVQLISGQHVPASDYSSEPIGMPYLTGPADFPDGRIVVTKYTESPLQTCEPGDILITVKGAGIGKLTRADQIYCISRQLMAIRAVLVDGGFLYQFMQHVAQKYLLAAAGLIPGITREDILETPIYTPPLAEQRKIAAILSTWDEAIATVERLIDALQRRKRGLMQRLLTGEVRFPEFVGSEWEFRKAGEIFASHSKRNNGNKELLSVTQEQGVIPRSMLATRVTMPEGSTENYKLVEPGDFVISLRTFQGGIEYSEYLGVVSPAYTVLKPRIPIVNAFYKHLFKSQDFIGRLSIAVVGIRDGKQISFSDFAAMRLAYPALAEQNRIAEVLDACDEQIAARQRMLDALVQQKRGLMQRLLTGEVRVQVDEATQPVAHTAASLDGRMEEAR